MRFGMKHVEPPPARCSVWQRDDGHCEAVLYEVFSWLSGVELAMVGSVCRGWRRAASSPSLWRHALQRRANLSRANVLALAAHQVSWRQEYVSTFASWKLEQRVPVDGSPLYAALSIIDDQPMHLVLVGDDATLAVWQECAERGWRARWSADMRVRGWRSAVRAQWSTSGERLLVAGALALADSWELLVINITLDEEKMVGHVASHARCSAGAAGCWVDAYGESFISFELKVFAPSIACTTVWLNASTQEAQSEYAGVTAPLLRIYNENGAHITHAAVQPVPLSSASAESIGPVGSVNDDNEYFRAIKEDHSGNQVTMTVLVTASGSGARGGTLSAWPLSELRPPPVLASTLGDLRERVRRRASQPARVAEEEPAPPDEAIVRALCTPPDDTCDLPAPPIGFVAHTSGRCLWVTLSDGSAWCVSLPTLRPLRHLSHVSHVTSSVDTPLLHYVQPAVSDQYFVSPRGARSGAVDVWSARSGARGTSLTHAAPALAALLPRYSRPDRAALLVLAGDAIYVWKSTATLQLELPAEATLI